jgi:predicted transcriptional regulator
LEAMPKWKRWNKKDVTLLQKLAKEGKSWEDLAKELGRSVEAVQKKARRLGVDVVVHSLHESQTTTTTAELVMPKELISVEEALKKLVAAMNLLEDKGLSKTDVMRLRTLIQSSNIYQIRVAEYINYRRIEQRLLEMEAKYDRLAEKLGINLS